MNIPKGYKILSLVLATSIFITAFPNPIFAAAEQNPVSEPVPTPVQAVDTSSKAITDNEAQIVGEVIDKREENVKHFLLDDMTYEAVVYPEPVHFQQNGQWKDIDNTLTTAKDENNVDILENKSNSYKIRVAKTSKANKLVKIKKDRYELSWNIGNVKDTPATVKAVNTKEIQALSKNEKATTLTKLQSTVIFPEIFANTDLEYIVTPDDVKENIILRQKVENPQYTMNIFTQNLSAKLLKDNSVEFYDQKDTSKLIYSFQAPVMIDASGQSSKDFQVILDKSETGYVLTLIPNAQWLSSPERVYPVNIDPPVDTKEFASNSISDTYVYSGSPNTNYSSATTMKVGKQGTYNNRAYIKFTLPELTEADMITNSYLHLHLKNSISTPVQVKMYNVLEDWDPAVLNWSNTSGTPAKPKYDSIIETYLNAQTPGDNYMSITPLAKKWYSTQQNYGVMLEADAASTNYAEFYTSEAGSSLMPYVTVHYTNNSGLEDYWTYHSQSSGRAGTSYVNDFNGNLILVHDTLSMTGSRMPISISHVYNSTEATAGSSVQTYPGSLYGNGWRLNFSQTVNSEIIGGTQYYVWTDDDGTKHYFKNYSGVWKDESGLDLILTINGDGSYTVKDKQDNLLEFQKLDAAAETRYLKSIKDNTAQNAITLGYEGTRLVSLTDPVNRVISLNYDANGNLESIVQKVSETEQRTTTFNYSGGLLAGINYPDGKSTSYEYYEDNKLKSAINYDGKKTEISYSQSYPRRVTKMQEAHTIGSTGLELNLAYGTYSTSFTDANGRKNIYYFNNYGNTISVRDDEGYAQYYKYGSDSSKNKLTLESKLQQTVTNYIVDHNAELPVESSGWSSYVGTGSTGASTPKNEQNYFGSQALKVYKSNYESNQGMQQTVYLEKGKTYTFSAYVKTSGVTTSNNKGASIYAGYQDSTGAWKKVEAKYINGTKDWQRSIVSFTLPEDAYSNRVDLKVSITEEKGSAYFDCLQLEDGTSANRYNIIENSDFAKDNGSGTPTFWTRNSDCDSTDKLAAITDTEHPKALDSRVFKFTGNPQKGKYLTQTVNHPGKAEDTFVLSGWAKGDAAPYIVGRTFNVDIAFYLNDGTIQWGNVLFTKDAAGWQYSSEKFAATKDYSKITVYITYQNQVNTAFFDGIQLYKEEFATEYSYYNDNEKYGNLETETNLDDESSEYDYNGTNDVKKYTDEENNESNFAYDASNPTKHQLKSVTSATSVVSKYEYDNFGNLTKTIIGDNTTAGAPYIQSSSTYTPDGNYLAATKDSRGNEIKYAYDSLKGTLDSFTDANGKVTNYKYDPLLDRLTEVSKTLENEKDNPADDETVKNSYSYENDLLKQISHNGFNYNFNYDSFGYLKSVLVGNQNLISNSYDYKKGLMTESAYGNGQKISFGYDSLDRVIEKKYTDKNGNTSTRASYSYDAAGNLGYRKDLVNGISYRYDYDSANRLSKLNDSKGNIMDYVYDQRGNIKQFSELVNGSDFKTQFTFDEDNRPKDITFNGTNKVIYSYAEPGSTVKLGRLTSTKVNIGGADKFTTTYSYAAGGYGTGSTTDLLEQISNNNKAISYTYDANGNIETITENNKTIKYYYNELNELIREDNQVINKTILYAYDLGGNILSKTEYAYTTALSLAAPVKTYVYTYDATWKDKLKSYDGKTLDYDEIGNLTADGVYTYSWEEGRQLASMSKSGQNISYKYDDSGIRLSKTVNGITTQYHLVGDKVTFETNGTDKIYYTYDAADKLVSMNLNGTEYYYIRNGQNDIIGLFDSSGAQVVTYTYDSWGKLISTTGTLASTVGSKNPYLYRGYRYDSETGLYYLQSRYYNPDWGRFVNADSNLGNPGELLSHNIFAYCQNNSIIHYDPDGHELVTAIIGGGIGALLGIAVAKYYNLSGWKYWACITGFAVGGAAIGWFAPQVVAAIARSKFISFGSAVLTSGSTMRDRLLNTIQNQKLLNCANQLYRSGSKIGDGGTADALKYELAKGLNTNAPHWLKALERIKNLENIIRKENLNSNDLAIARKLLQDLRNAVSKQ